MKAARPLMTRRRKLEAGEKPTSAEAFAVLAFAVMSAAAAVPYVIAWKLVSCSLYLVFFAFLSSQ